MTEESSSNRGTVEPPLALGLRVRRQIVFWGLALAALIAFLYVFKSVLLPFLAGMALAYFLDPVADRLERMGASRGLATTIILFLFIIFFVLVLVLLVPVLSTQLAGFLERMPGYIVSIQSLIANTESEWIKRLIGEGQSNIRENLDEVLKQGAGWLSTVVASIWNSGKALIDLVSLFIITPIVAFYLLYDWDRMVAKVDSWLPRQHRATIREIFRDIDIAIAGFVRGQGTVCIILGAFYALALSLLGLNFGLLIGMFAGLVSFIPFVGSITGFVLAVGVALVQFWPDFWWIVLVGAVFGFGQFVEGNFLQPKLVGESVGLHPVWLMFALLAFGALLGFTGVLIAVPAAAVVGVLVRFGLKKYLESPLYHGEGGQN